MILHRTVLKGAVLNAAEIILTGHIGERGSNCLIARLTSVQASGHPSSLR